MERIPYNSDFSLLFEFVDLDGFPVNVSEADVDFIIYSRQTMPALKAFVHGSKVMNAAPLDDSNCIVVPIKAGVMAPGKIKAVVNIHAAVDNAKDHDHKIKNSEFFVITPEVPVEIIEHVRKDNWPDFHCHHDHHGHRHLNTDRPIKVKCVFNLRNPKLVRHVTKGELDRAISSAMSDITPAQQADIDPILEKFKIN